MFRGKRHFARRYLLLRLQQHWAGIQTVTLLFVAFFVFSSGVFATIVTRLIDRSLYIDNAIPSATANYTVSFNFNTLSSVGSIDFLFCVDPIPSEPITPANPVDHHPCVPPTGLDVSGAVLSNQTGETGFSIATITSNHIVLSRTPSVVGSERSSYTFSNIHNPNAAATAHSYAIRLSTYASTDASGPLIDLGSVLTQVNQAITLETQVPPMLIFCVAAAVDPECNSTSGGNYTDMGNLDPTQTLTATSQMAVGTNASNGFVITANGTTMAAGTHVIDNLVTPTASAPGNSQFGINLVANTTPALGADPDGSFANAIVSPNYAIQNEFLFNDGDVIATAPNVSLLRRYTVSYIVNSPPKLRAGVYTTTLTYICTGRF